MSLKKILILTVIVAVISVSAVVLAGKWRSQDIYRVVTISGNYTVSDDEILKMSGLSKNIELSPEQINENDIINRLKIHNEIKKVIITKIPPEELSVQIIEKNPIAIINFDNNLKLIDEELEMYPFDEKGKIFDLPLINGINESGSNVNSYSGKKKYSGLKSAVYILISINKESKYLNSCISEINLSDKDRLILYASEKGFPVYLPKYSDNILENKKERSDLSNRIKVLKQFFENIFPSERTRDISEIDLTYSNQLIITYEENQN
ncbi:MAG: FtsQ-type POTRA domain-containing protein [Ignavibacteria bacterium]|nr:FtsQ-type POTRA domain-containing protein [Ignavibacteria bacterium]